MKTYRRISVDMSAKITGKIEMNKNEKNKETKHQNGNPVFLSLNLFFILLGIMIAILALLFWRNILNVNNLWQADFVGLGMILIILSVRIYLNPEQRSNALSRFIPGITLIYAGLAFLLNFNIWWLLAFIIGIGAIAAFGFWFLRREVKERRLTQETLRESEIKYGHIIDNANSVIMEIDPSGKIMFLNKFALDFLGYKQEEILGKNVLGTIIDFKPSIYSTPRTLTGEIAAHPEKYLQNEKEYPGPKGEKAWVSWTYKPVFDEENDLKEILCIGIDRTEQKRSEDLAVQQIKERSAIDERTRLARDLHDAVSQTLFSASLMAEVLPRVWKKSEEEGLKSLEEIRQLNRGALAEMRTLLFELRPAALADVDLAELLRQLTEAVTGRVKVAVTLEVQGTCEIPVDVKIALYRIAQEALNNISKHSGATRAQVTLDCRMDEITLHIIDNGHGFNISQIGNGSFGLGNMKERANQIGASIKIESGIDEGTEISVVWHNKAREALP